MHAMKQMKKPVSCAVVARVDEALRKKLDTAARKARRSRSAELVARLEQSLREQPVLGIRQ